MDVLLAGASAVAGVLVGYILSMRVNPLNGQLREQIDILNDDIVLLQKQNANLHSQMSKIENPGSEFGGGILDSVLSGVVSSLGRSLEKSLQTALKPK